MAKGPSVAGVPASWRLVGLTRIAVLLIFIVSATWTTFLAILNVAPDATANYLMNTTQFDDGEFWMLTDVDYKTRAASVVGLGAVSAVYLYLIVLILVPSCTSKPRAQRIRPPKRTSRWTQIVGPGTAKILDDIATFRHELISQRGRYRKVWELDSLFLTARRDKQTRAKRTVQFLS